MILNKFNIFNKKEYEDITEIIDRQHFTTFSNRVLIFPSKLNYYSSDLITNYNGIITPQTQITWKDSQGYLQDKLEQVGEYNKEIGKMRR